MAEIGMLLSVAQTLFAALECSDLKKLWSIFGYKSELDDLKETVSTIHKFLLDADSKQDLTNEAQDWIQKLTEAIYEADDIFDYFVFMVEQKKVTVGGFFDFCNPIIVAYRLSKGIKNVRKRLDKIAGNHSRYGFNSISGGYVAVRRKLQETDSSVQDVVGREGDVTGVIDMLVECDVVCVVGIGGLGKTTLAQLVFNDDNVKKEYSLRMWVCVSDQDETHFDLKLIIGKILESATGDKHEGFSLDSLLTRVRKILEVNKYFLVLDDVWNEDHLEWDKLMSVLRVGWSGSKVVVTTRSKKTGQVIRDGCIYELKGLSEDESWRLFQMTAFRDKEGQGSSRTLIDAGKKIVKKCVNVPLAIKVVGSLLYSEDEDTWLSFQERELSDIRNDKNEIMHILKLSYHYLDPPLKSCFAYCALFPKDFVIKKDMLISLWIAQGYVVPLDKGQSIEDAAEEYFSTLLRKCFFQDTQVNGYGQIVSCKIHDLIHDVAQQIAGNEIDLGNDGLSVTTHNRIRHLFHVQREGGVVPFTKTKIRSYLRDGWSSLLPVDTLISNCIYLRSLDLHNLDIKILPDSIGNLLHLRYLDLSWNHDLRKLPKTITKLHFLQTLYLKDCFCLQELPKNLSILVNLRQLDIIGCKGLSYMPSGLDKLSNLCVLTTFPVAEHNSNVGQLKDLKALTKLKGDLSIWIKGNMKYTRPLLPEEGYLKRMERLKSLRISWKGEENDRRIADEEALLEDLQPHHNLKELMLIGYYGVVVPRWGRENTAGTFLPNLVKFELENCLGLKAFPSMGKLHSLKFLKLVSLINFEYCEETTSGSSTFLSSLEELVLWDLPNIKGWWKTVGPSQPSFPCLSKLVVGRCPNLTSIPPCPTVSTLSLYWINKSLPITMGKDHMSILSRNSSQSSLPVGHLTKIDITGAKNLTSLSEMSELFQTCSSSLQSLTIENCYQLESLSGGLEHLNSVETLKIHDVPNLSFFEERDQDNAWVSLNQSLRSLDLCHLPRLVKLPKGISHLTSLQTMKIQLCQSLEEIPGWIGSLSCVQSLYLIGCDKLVSLPEEISKLTSLRRFEVRRCADVLKERCQSPDGVDWLKIQFIPSVSIS